MRWSRLAEQIGIRHLHAPGTAGPRTLAIVVNLFKAAADPDDLVCLHPRRGAPGAKLQSLVKGKKWHEANKLADELLALMKHGSKPDGR
jgi:hypothetical protein